MKFLILFLIFFLPVNLFADFVIDYYQITNNSILGQLSIETGMIRSEQTYQSAVKNREALLSNGIIIADDTIIDSIKNEYQLGNYKVQIVLKIFPPTEHGYGGGNYTSQLSVKINEIEKLNIPFGYYAPFNELSINKIVLHSDGIIYYTGEFSKNGMMQKLDLFDYSFFTTLEDQKKCLTEKELNSIISK